MRNKICCIFNLAPLYNAAIYKLMDEKLICDFYIGDYSFSPIETMHYDELRGFKKKLPFKKIKGNFYWQKGALKLAFKSYKNYIITGEPYCLSTWGVLILNKLLGKKTFLWTHGWYGDETVVKAFIKKIFFGLSYKILLYGDYARNLMLREGFKNDKLVCIYNSMDYDSQLKVRISLTDSNIFQDHFKNDWPVILFVGRIQKSKRLDLLIHALYRLNKNGLYCNLIIIGQETEESNLHKMVAKCELESRVWFYGPSYDETSLGELIYNADVCVSPGNVGLTAIHCLVYGLPVITHKNFSHQGPEFEAIEPGKTGDFFIENSQEDLCKKIEFWIKLNSEDRNNVRKNCYQMIQEKYNPYQQIEILKNNIISN